MLTVQGVPLGGVKQWCGRCRCLLCNMT